MKNILVSGANGQLGSEIRRISKNFKGCNFFFTDVNELDITKLESSEQFIIDNSIDIIVNCAAYTNVDKAEDDEFTADLINHKAVNNLATLAKKNNVFLFHISTDYVFDGSMNTPYTEDIKTAPLGIYGITKLKGEQAIINSGCKYLIIRTSWLYSEFGNNFVKTMMRLTSEKDVLNVVFDQVGTPTYAADLAELILSIINQGSYNEKTGIYHFSNEGVCSWYDFAKKISKFAGTKCNIKPCHSSEFPSKVRRPNYSVLDKTKLKLDFKYDIPYWEDSLSKCVAKLLNN